MALRLNTPERLKLSWSQKKNILRKALLIKIFWATWLKFQPPKVKKNTKMKKKLRMLRGFSFETGLSSQQYDKEYWSKKIKMKILIEKKCSA